MQITWYGTATLQVAEGTSRLLLDPFIARNPACRQVGLSELAGFETIFLTHGHLDHAADIPNILSCGKSVVYCGPETANNLIREGAASDRFRIVRPGDRVRIGTLEVEVLRGRHVCTDLRRKLQMIAGLRTPGNMKEFARLIQFHRRYPAGDVLMYRIEGGGCSLLAFGSLNLDLTETYAPADWSALPYQGRSDMTEYTLSLLNGIRPRGIFLHHFDDSFPPVTRQEETTALIQAAASRFSEMKVIVPQHRKEYTLE